MAQPACGSTGRRGCPMINTEQIVVLHHGAGEHSGHYPHAVTKLAAAGYGVYALDARGHGRSEGRRASIDRFEQLTTDLHAVVSQAMRDHRDLAVFLLGYSLGGAGVLSYALKHLDELAGAIVVDSALGRGSGISRIQFGIASLLSAITPRALLIRLCGADLVGDPLLQRNTRRIRSSITAAAAHAQRGGDRYAPLAGSLPPAAAAPVARPRRDRRYREPGRLSSTPARGAITS